jgi:hypothetical protein
VTYEYMRVWDSSEEMTEINELAREGWRVIASFNDERRGQMFILERERVDTTMLELSVSGEVRT